MDYPRCVARARGTDMRPRLVRDVTLRCFLLACPSFASADQTVALVPVQDAFVRELDPTLNFGGAGALCVAGTNSANASGDPRGRFDSVLQFDASPAVAAFDTSFGAGNWIITDIELQAMEVGTPLNPIFPRGAGTFMIRWISEDLWTEGTGI